ncbi:4Fe-4S binding protein [Pseudobacteroides cellulosolvens]|uniref:Cobyrinic acid ac-diamide synthase n=1 Tax=Pseudobacteroides cellulosolvens ATCC 35603 = DSM 2933 TaxID=398512 RepID=A0A0L6JJU1_9FIRM|nr:ATP-binding protein [Pseudobacteroides cellulosolvens]KNY25973.1 Cobyrinic acid ac-diamide synthase [Pseudobacteroides cellulosolvens ATCC 35603 = DSM 2933]
MQIAVLSGKGGTGKTFVSVNLVYAKGKSVYIDCDVEEPNGRLFLKPQIKLMEKVNTMIPAVDAQKCTGCRKCVELCKFNALAYIKNKLLVFQELCHACKGCVMLCPQKALSESSKQIGHIERGVSGEVEVITGVLNTGEATGVPIIRKLISSVQKDRTVVLDCPPGSACSVMESIKDADFCLMVAEPTVFGIHNFDMIYKLVKLFGKPHALVVNKDIGDRSLIEKYCDDNDIRIIASIPYDSELALINSKGFVAAKENERYWGIFKEILDTIEQEVCYEATGHIER